MSARRSARHGVAAWLTGSAAARTVYDLVAAIVRGSAVAPVLAERAGQATPDVWERVLVLEGCAAWLDNVRRTDPTKAAAFAPAHALVRAEGERALRNSVAMVHQLAEIAKVAGEVGVPVLVLKGSARLLAGEVVGGRTMADIDLLVPGEGGVALHRAVCSQLGYWPEELGTPGRHFPSLVREGSLPVEIHRRLTDRGSALDRRMWEGTRRMTVGGSAIEIPSPTALLLHTLEHATVVHRAARYRLRDVLDVATAWVADVDGDEVRRYLRRHPERRAARTLLAASRPVTGEGGACGWPTDGGAERRAWRRVRRVARTRLLAPVQVGVPPASDPRVQVLSQIAEGSSALWLRMLARGAIAPGRAVRLIAGRWLPVEVARARASAELEVPESPPSKSS